jgi:DNA-binding NtrC family response regulator
MKNTKNTGKGEGLDQGTLTLDGWGEIPAASQQGFVGEESFGGE